MNLTQGLHSSSFTVASKVKYENQLRTLGHELMELALSVLLIVQVLHLMDTTMVLEERSEVKCTLTGLEFMVWFLHPLLEDGCG